MRTRHSGANYHATEEVPPALLCRPRIAVYDGIRAASAPVSGDRNQEQRGSLSCSWRPLRGLLLRCVDSCPAGRSCGQADLSHPGMHCSHAALVGGSCRRPRSGSLCRCSSLRQEHVDAAHPFRASSVMSPQTWTETRERSMRDHAAIHLPFGIMPESFSGTRSVLSPRPAARRVSASAAPPYGFRLSENPLCNERTRIFRTFRKRRRLTLGAGHLRQLGDPSTLRANPIPADITMHYNQISIAGMVVEDDGGRTVRFIHSLPLQPERRRATVDGSTAVRSHRRPERSRVLQTGVSVKRHFSRIFPAHPRSLASVLIPRPAARRVSASTTPPYGLRLSENLCAKNAKDFPNLP
jgi:hypothetical protein